MKYMQRVLALGAFLAGVSGMSTATADDGPKTLEMSLKADAVCTRCHDESESKPILAIYQTKHGVRADGRTPTCQECHGESKNHLGGNVEGKGRPKPDVIFGGKHTSAGYLPADPQEQAKVCLTCHDSGARQHWAGSEHQSRDVSCSNCHKVHAPKDPVLTKATQPEVCYTCHKEQRAQTHRISTHPLDAGKMACTDCHNPHGSTGPKLLVKNSVNETCYTCHAEKRGPYLWEHSPVVDDCSNCHTPHGSSSGSLLKARLPFLCQECHQDHGSSLKGGVSIPTAVGNPAANASVLAASLSTYPTVQGNGRMCLNCHVMVHGSNNPNGSKFNR